MKAKLSLPEPERDIEFVDTHCHVPWTEGKLHSSLPPPAGQLAEFKKAGGQFLVTCSIDLQSTKESLSFSKMNKDVYFSCGWAPQTVTYTSVDKYETIYPEWIKTIEANIGSIIAFGEIGLDFHHAKTLEKRNRQIAELDKILGLVKKWDRPIVLHVRNAGPSDMDRSYFDHDYNKPEGAARAVLALLDKHGVHPSKVLFHCFSGPVSMNNELVKRGFWFSVPSSAFGIGRWNKISQSLPIERLVTETDSPFQHPWAMEPMNSPVNARYAVSAIAAARNKTQQETSRILVSNAKKFFRIE